MILSRKTILEEIRRNNIKITPFNKKNVGPASIDVTLDNKFRTFNNKKVILREDVDYKKYSKLIIKKQIILRPGEFILGITREKIKLPDNICGWIYGRSRFARFGLNVHSVASFIQPGVNNKQVFEISNLSGMPLILKPGTKIAQIILERTEGRAKFRGKFNNQKL